MKMILYTLINVLIVALFLYSKLTPYKSNLTEKYKSAFLFFERIFQPILNFLRKIAKPAQVGNGIAVDMSQIILPILFLITLKFL
jgi:uncharacterized protein YggT (Ycf19 family)